MKAYNYKWAGGNIDDFHECHIKVREVIEERHRISDIDILSFSEIENVFFLTKNEIKALWKKYRDAREIELGLEYIPFYSEYANDFGNFCIMRKFVCVKDARWFSHLTDFAFELYSLNEIR